MAVIDERGPHQFRVRVRRRVGGQTVYWSETYETEAEAKKQGAIREGKILGDEHVDRKAVRAITVGQACEWFLDRIAPMDEKTGRRAAKTPHAKNQASKLRYWIDSEFANWSIVSLKPWDLIEWRDELIGECESSAQTIVHRLNTLSQVYIHVALAQKLDVTNPVGPNVRPSLGHGRTRRLDTEPDKEGKDEEARLLEACAGSSRKWLKSAVIISLETCMRQGELAGLTWDRVKLNAEYPHCDLLRTKNERPRRVPLSDRAIDAFRELLPKDANQLGKRPVFPVETPRAFGHAWRSVVNDENFPDLRWHDLRHEAISRLFERTDLRENEIMAISGHLRPEMLTRYTHLRADRLRSRLR